MIPISDLKPASAIVSGKTKTVYETNDPYTVAFRQKTASVTADGTGTIDADGEMAGQLVENLLLQNENIFSFLNALDIPTTFRGRCGDFLFHESCLPLTLEFVYRGALCHGSSIIARHPEKYGSNITVNGQQTAHHKFFNEDGTVILFDEPILETFHKYCIVQRPDGSVRMMKESDAKKDPRYYADGNMTKFMHPDPILISDRNDKRYWDVYDQKNTLVSENKLTTIDRTSGEMDVAAQHTFVEIQKLKDDSYISYQDECFLQQMTLKIMLAIDAACRNTVFKKAYINGGGKIKMGEELGYAVVIDGKCEFGRMPDGTYKLTDDMVSDNMRWAFGGKPSVSLRRMFQNYDSFEQKLLIAATVADGTKDWQNPSFLRVVRQHLR